MAGKSGGMWPSLFLALKTRLAGMWAALRAAGRGLGHRNSTSAASLSNGQERIERAKYTSPALPLAADRDELPDSYGPPRVTLMVVDPYLIHAYWDIDITSLPRETASAVLRFHVASERSFEVDVDLRTRNWYVNVESPAKSCYAELGVKTAAGEFRPLASSNQVQTPRAWPVARLPENAGPVRDENKREVGPAKGSAEAAAAPTPVASQSEQSPPVPRIARSPRRVDAAQVLEQKLAEIYALRPWRSRAGAPFEVATSAAPRSSSAGLPTGAPAPLEHPGSPLDPTALAEHAFFPGLPSSPSERSRAGVQP